MFENTLLIIKPDFMMNRKCILQHLLSKGFQIQGNRKLSFTPEDAGEFYKDLADDKCYMLYVILLSKGTSEAFILTKTNAAMELLHTLICFFGTSMEMDRHVHVSRNVEEARREITFIFPNYIHEPIEIFDKHRFSKQPVIPSLLSEAFNIIKQPSENQHENWRLQLSDWLFKQNPVFPQISNQCSRSPHIALQEKCQQTDLTMVKDERDMAERASIVSSSTIPGATSDLMSSSSCVSCSSFKSAEPCPEKVELEEFAKRIKLRAIKTLEEPLMLQETSLQETSKNICEEHTEVETGAIRSADETKEEFELEEEVVLTMEDMEFVPDISYISIVEEAPPKEVLIEEMVQIEKVFEEHPPAEGEGIIAEVKMEESDKKDEAEDTPLIESAAEGPPTEPETEPQPPAESASEPAAEAGPEEAPQEEEAKAAAEAPQGE